METTCSAGQESFPETGRARAAQLCIARSVAVRWSECVSEWRGHSAGHGSVSPPRRHPLLCLVPLGDFHCALCAN